MHHICRMIRDLKAFYVAIVKNKVICYDTNLRLFQEKFSAIEKDSRNYDWFYREFKKSEQFSITITDKEYFFQKVV